MTWTGHVDGSRVGARQYWSLTFTQFLWKQDKQFQFYFSVKLIKSSWIHPEVIHFGVNQYHKLVWNHTIQLWNLGLKKFPKNSSSHWMMECETFFFYICIISSAVNENFVWFNQVWIYTTLVWIHSSLVYFHANRIVFTHW